MGEGTAAFEAFEVFAADFTGFAGFETGALRPAERPDVFRAACLTAFNGLEAAAFPAFRTGFATFRPADDAFFATDFVADAALRTSFRTTEGRAAGLRAAVLDELAGFAFAPFPGAGFLEGAAFAAAFFAGAFAFVFKGLAVAAFFTPYSLDFFFGGDPPPDFLPLTVGMSSPPILESRTLSGTPKKNGAIYQPSGL